MATCDIITNFTYYLLCSKAEGDTILKYISLDSLDLYCLAIIGDYNKL